ncbi:MAG: hypothetical protein HZA15_15110 [Nitrospirae bacterium]|nr:hypothetical protein [Nitrospirota bacterium]
MIFKGHRKIIAGAMAVFITLALQACVSGKALRTDAVKSGDIPGTYTLILYGGNYSDDLETVAFLDKEGDRYTFEPYAPDFVFRATKGLTADRALGVAGEFIRAHPNFHTEQLRSIRDEEGEIIGYELRPLYLPFAFGSDDILDVDYWLKEGRVLVYVKLKPSLEMRKKDVEQDAR